MTEKERQKTENEADRVEERGLGGMGSDGDTTCSASEGGGASTEQRRSIDFLRASDVMGARGWEGDEPQPSSQEENHAQGWGPQGNVGRGPKGYLRSDNSIKEDVCERLTQDPVIDASDVEVEVKDGEVTLTGTVAGSIEKSRAEDILVEIRGVKNILNRITVQGAFQRPRNPDASRPTAGA